MTRFVLALAFLLGAISASAQYAPAVPPADGLIGFWSTNAGSVLEVHDCGAEVCIRIVTISQKAPGVTDARNPDPALRDRPVCKVDIGTKFHLTDPDHAEGGRVYEPVSGKTYKAAMSSDGNTLTLRGYIGIKTFGRSESWKRTSADSATCVGTTHR